MSNGLVGSGQTAWTVSAPSGEVPILVVEANDPVPAAFALMGTTVPDKRCVRIVGGCANMTPQDKVDMITFFTEAFRGYRGLLFSGATRDVDANGDVDPMVTDVPVAIARENPESKVLGTVPRTDLLRLRGESMLKLGSGETGINPGYSGVLIVQQDAETPAGWDGDLGKYHQLMSQWQQSGGFETVGIVSWNGGGVTAKEIEAAAQKRWPTILVRGSGRKTDEYAAKLADGSWQLPQGHRVVVVDRADAQTLRSALIDAGFLSNA